MRRFIGALGLALLLLWGLTAGRAAAADTELRVVVTNGGTDVANKADIHVYPGGTHTPTGVQGNANVGWADSGQPIAMPEGTYDVRITFEDGGAHKVVWLDKLAVAGQVTKTEELGMPIAEVRYTVTNGGTDVGGHGDIHIYPAGTHTPNGVQSNAQVGWANSGQTIRLPAGTYDVRVTFSDGNAEKAMWLNNQTFTGTMEKTVEVDFPLAEVRYTVTNGGADTGNKGDIHVYPAGTHSTAGTANNPNIGWTNSGQTLRLPAGTFDVRVTFEDGDAKKAIWLDKQVLSGKVEQTVEVGVAVAQVRTVVTNGGTEVKDKAQVVYYPPGKRDGNGITWSNSGETVKVPEGVYDIRIRFADGAAKKEMWLTNQTLSNTVEKTVELGRPIADVRYVVTNGGKDTGDKGEAHFYPHGHHDGSPIDWTRSGQTTRLPEGAYDVHITFADGEAKRDIWIDNQTFSGKLEKTVEVGLPIAEIRIVVTNGGIDTGDKGEAHFYPHGHHDGGAADWARSGGKVRIPEGVYDVHVTFADGEVRKNLWLDNRSFAGSVEKTVEIGAAFTDVH
jgi:DUF971 family protein